MEVEIGNRVASPGSVGELSLKDILKIQQSDLSSRAVSNVLGDGYLYKHNPVYRGVRERFITSGLGFTSDDLFHTSVFYFFNLKENTNRKKVVYYDNVTPLRRLEAQAVGVFHLKDVQAMYIKKNILLYESGRCLAHKMLFGETQLNEFLPKNNSTILKILISEAYSIANEYIARLFAVDPLHVFFLNYCSARNISKQDRHFYREAMNELGYAEVFRICLIGLLVKFCFEDIDNVVEFKVFLKSVIKEMKFSETNWDLRFEVFKTTAVSQSFHVGCALPFFMYLGFKDPQKKIIDLNILEVLHKDPLLHHEFLNLLSHYR